MTIFKVLILGVLIFSSSVFAENITLSPQIIRERLLEKNLSVMEAFEQIQKAKIQVNLARTNLLPSLNVNLNLASNPIAFIANSVSFLVPFLIPGNWFLARESEYLLEAEKQAYYLVELNSYASAYSLYQTILGDLEIRKVLYQQYTNLVRIASTVEVKVNFGLATKADLEQAIAASELARVQVSQMDELLGKELPALKNLIAAGVEDTLNLKSGHLSEIAQESMSPAQVYREFISKSPEHAQVLTLIQASQNGSWAKVFAFINSASLSSFGGGGESASLTKLTPSASFNIGLGLFPAYELTQQATDVLRLRQQEIEREQARLAEASLGAITEAKIQYQQAVSAENRLKTVLDAQLKNYKLGLTDILHVLDTQNSMTTAALSRVKSQADLDNLRISVARALLVDEFSSIKGCQAKPATNSGFWSGIKDFFSSIGSRQSVEEICRGQAAAEKVN